MYINRDTDSFKINHTATLLQALEKLSQKKTKILFVVDHNEAVVGALADGDVRRYLIEKSQDLNAPVINATNKDFLYIYNDQPISNGYNLLSTKIKNVPILDKSDLLVGVIGNDEPVIEVAGRKIGDQEPSFIIAEIGNNHNGSLKLAKELVDLAVDAGADCVKFQMRDMASMYNNAGDDDDASQDLGAQYVLDLLKRFQLSDDEFEEIFAYCKQKGILALCTPFDEASADKLEKIGVAGFKVASADLTNHRLLKHLAAKKLPLILSTGMSVEQEIIAAVELLEKESASFALLHCNSTYPAPFKDVNLTYLERLKTLGRTVVGYSGHERGYAIPVASIPLGAKIVEKHFTVDKSMEGNDHKVSLLPEEFKEMVKAIRAVEESLGSPNISKTITQGEMMNRETLAKSVVADVNIKKGDVITEDMLAIKSPGKGLAPYKLSELVNRVAVRDIPKNDFLYQSDIDGTVVQAQKYKLPLKYGIPVRYHDFATICKGGELEMIEFHLSYKDLSVDIKDYLSGSYDMDVAIHAPELFENDHVLDLCSADEEYRQQSIKHMQRVIDMARDVKQYFRNKNERVCIVVNCGGFTSEGFVPAEERQALYDKVADAFSKLDTEGVELIPQTMPPFPWHFGGQQYHNLFVDQDEIIEFCEKYNSRICFDLSHTALACNYYKWDLYEFTRHVAKYSAHHHISDAKGADGEGLQIGDGELDFVPVFDALIKNAPKSTWIPEIWQGHKNNGEGFWNSLNRLENIINLD
ncbi:N-acetylneuraminate synthase family protein [Vibrio plantisponsor]|uniref:N-acetylneuraminate synthase family protein n=1 Tax=Vibrio plantisponsor TaxID=664643 RepID=A0ABU4IJ69_9VIBR|nr:N-acetylneuraminate synthase family protein [Vibrio plantisponsor]MDW6018309.1 N-acetylneuraminate synthase family protein [Vibrio plantisponsor]NNM41886.1 TIM barrel protein [Vibrio plantisponsor]